MVWSFCNEGGCGSGANHTLASAFRQTAYDYDGTRKVSGNMRGTVGPGTLSDLIDVQGLSHPTVRKKRDSFGPFSHYNDYYFAKTGSGQTHGKPNKTRRCLFRRAL